MSEQHETESALAIYGSGTDIKTLAERIKICLPGGEKLQAHEALALAQLAVAYKLNPFNGEVWFIPGKGTQVGIKGLRKTAHDQAQYWIEDVPLTAADKKALGIPDNAIAYKCLVYRTDLIRQSAEAIKIMREAGMADAFERYAYKPTEGIGYWVQGESTKMRGDQAARKRAEAEALKRSFDLPFASEVGNGNRVGYVDAEWSEVASGGPAWTPATVQAGEPEQVHTEPPDLELPEIAPAAKVAPAAKPATNMTSPRVKVSSGQWRAKAAALAAELPYYQKDGQANYYHMLNAAHEHAGVSEITDANLADVLAALRQHGNDVAEEESCCRAALDAMSEPQL